ncbi:hypothetical protein EVAR_872_1 [Eumeta japonica]|uniref:Uncharacterized protein n=1 Tax=Eumeta variegata TaxID=151549 RepID=A0A4C1SGM9_EUMVA|nr:hypothetical protein EVAR_872_1 [Eumeta japonica]
MARILGDYLGVLEGRSAWSRVISQTVIAQFARDQNSKLIFSGVRPVEATPIAPYRPKGTRVKEFSLSRDTNPDTAEAKTSDL